MKRRKKFLKKKINGSNSKQRGKKIPKVRKKDKKKIKKPTINAELLIVLQIKSVLLILEFIGFKSFAKRTFYLIGDPKRTPIFPSQEILVLEKEKLSQNNDTKDVPYTNLSPNIVLLILSFYILPFQEIKTKDTTKKHVIRKSPKSKLKKRKPKKKRTLKGYVSTFYGYFGKLRHPYHIFSSISCIDTQLLKIRSLADLSRLKHLVIIFGNTVTTISRKKNKKLNYPNLISLEMGGFKSLSSIFEVNCEKLEVLRLSKMNIEMLYFKKKPKIRKLYVEFRNEQNNISGYFKELYKKIDVSCLNSLFINETWLRLNVYEKEPIHIPKSLQVLKVSGSILEFCNFDDDGKSCLKTLCLNLSKDKILLNFNPNLFSNLEKFDISKISRYSTMFTDGYEVEHLSEFLNSFKVESLLKLRVGCFIESEKFTNSLKECFNFENLKEIEFSDSSNNIDSIFRKTFFRKLENLKLKRLKISGTDWNEFPNLKILSIVYCKSVTDSLFQNHRFEKLIFLRIEKNERFVAKKWKKMPNLKHFDIKASFSKDFLENLPFTINLDLNAVRNSVRVVKKNHVKTIIVEKHVLNVCEAYYYQELLKTMSNIKKLVLGDHQPFFYDIINKNHLVYIEFTEGRDECADYMHPFYRIEEEGEYYDEDDRTEFNKLFFYQYILSDIRKYKIQKIKFKNFDWLDAENWPRISVQKLKLSCVTFRRHVFKKKMSSEYDPPLKNDLLPFFKIINYKILKSVSFSDMHRDEILWGKFKNVEILKIKNVKGIRDSFFKFMKFNCIKELTIIGVNRGKEFKGAGWILNTGLLEKLKLKNTSIQNRLFQMKEFSSLKELVLIKNKNLSGFGWKKMMKLRKFEVVDCTNLKMTLKGLNERKIKKKRKKK